MSVYPNRNQVGLNRYWYGLLEAIPEEYRNRSTHDLLLHPGETLKIYYVTPPGASNHGWLFVDVMGVAATSTHQHVLATARAGVDSAPQYGNQSYMIAGDGDHVGTVWEFYRNIPGQGWGNEYYLPGEANYVSFTNDPSNDVDMYFDGMFIWIDFELGGVSQGSSVLIGVGAFAAGAVIAYVASKK